MSKLEHTRYKDKERTQQEIQFMNKKRKLFIDWFSGLCGGFASVTACAPLDLARTRNMVLATTKSHGVVRYNGFFDTLKKVYQNEGFKGLYKGYNVTAFTIPFFHSLYFSIFYWSKTHINEAWRPDEYVLSKNILAAIFTGFICDTLTNPLWVVRTRIQSQYLHKDPVIKYRGIFSGLSRIYHEEGFRALYKGLIASYVGLTHAAILYPLYEELKKQMKKYKGEALTNTDIFLASLTSKFVAMVVTYPHVVMRARLQDNRTRLKRKDEKITFLQMAKTSYKNEGIIGLYSGLRIDLIRCLPANAITFLTFEMVKRNLERIYFPKQEE